MTQIQDPQTTAPTFALFDHHIAFDARPLPEQVRHINAVMCRLAMVEAQRMPGDFCTNLNRLLSLPILEPAPTPPPPDADWSDLSAELKLGVSFLKTLLDRAEPGDAVLLVRTVKKPDGRRVQQVDCIPNVEDITDAEVRACVSRMVASLPGNDWSRTVDLRITPPDASPQPKVTRTEPRCPRCHQLYDACGCGLEASAAPQPKGETEKMYPCTKCGKLRTKAEGGTAFSHCDECWEGKPTPPPTDDKPQVKPWPKDLTTLVGKRITQRPIPVFYAACANIPATGVVTGAWNDARAIELDGSGRQRTDWRDLLSIEDPSPPAETETPTPAPDEQPMGLRPISPTRKCGSCGKVGTVEHAKVPYETTLTRNGHVCKVSVRAMPAIQCRECRAIALTDESFAALDWELERMAGPIPTAERDEVTGVLEAKIVALMKERDESNQRHARVVEECDRLRSDINVAANRLGIAITENAALKAKGGGA